MLNINVFGPLNRENCTTYFEQIYFLSFITKLNIKETLVVCYNQYFKTFYKQEKVRETTYISIVQVDIDICYQLSFYLKYTSLLPDIFNHF